MAERRMFAKTVVMSDAFLDMPASSRLFYYDLGMRADDDGFVNSPRRVMRETGASEDDLNILLAKRFIIGFESGVVVVKHWKVNNYLQGDRHKPTEYQEELAMLEVKKNRSYSLIGEEQDARFSDGRNRKDEEPARLESHRQTRPVCAKCGGSMAIADGRLYCTDCGSDQYTFEEVL